MRTSKDLLLIHKTQFGYHNNAYKHCLYLKDRYNITFICFDSGKKKIKLDGIKVHYIPQFPQHQGIIFTLWRTLSFMLYTILYLLFFKGIIFIYYFKGAIWYKRIFKKKRMILDIRTLSVKNDISYNQKEDLILRKTALLYDHVTFLSEGMRKKIEFPLTQSSILPLGADIISDKKKDFESLKLLYVGTLTNRNIDITLNGIKKFINKYPSARITYDIVGDGNTPIDLEKLIVLAEKLKLNSIITFHGRIPNTELKPFFENCNIGVSFVPKTDYFEYQPVTKTFEYIMSGLFTIGTSTYENKKIINSTNGVLIEDNQDSFCEALEYIYKNKENIRLLNISSSVIDYQWEKIVNNILLPVLNNNQ